MGAAGQATGTEPTADVAATCTTVSGTLRIVASRAAHRTATSDDGDPSTPTTTPLCVKRPDMCAPSCSDGLPLTL